MTHTVTRNPTKHNATFKAAVFWCPSLPFLNLSFLYLGKRFLSFPCFPAVYRQSLHMIYNNLSCAISSKTHLFAILCNNLSYNLMFLQSFLNESRQDVKYVGLMAGTFLCHPPPPSPFLVAR